MGEDRRYFNRTRPLLGGALEGDWCWCPCRKDEDCTNFCMKIEPIEDEE